MPNENLSEITQLMQRWGQCRDQGRWEELLDCYAPSGEMHVTWYSGAANGFVEASRQTFKPTGPRSKHIIGTPLVDIHNDRALAETNVQILGRMRLAETLIDNISYARFIDRLERHNGKWKIAMRRAVYEKDRLDAVTPSPAFDQFMSETDFSKIPECYRFIGFRLLQMGRELMDNILTDGSDEAAAYYAQSKQWLIN